MNTNDHSISPLPQRIQPLPWEDLGSFLNRTARHMGYETTSWLLQPETISYQIDPRDLSTLSKQMDYDFLSHLLLLSEETLYHLTLHQLSPILNDHPPFVEAESRKLRRSTHSIGKQILSKNKLDDFCFFSPNIRFCPACLTETIAYDRLYWRLKHLVTCPYHGMILQKYCAACSKQIPSLRMFITHCPSCRQPLHQDTKTMNVQTHPAFSFLLHGDLLTLKVLGHQEKKTDQHMLPLPHDPRATLPPEQYFLLLRVICASIKALDETDLFTFLPPPVYELLTLLEHSLRVSTKRSTQVQVAIAHWLFASWPDRFFAFLDTIYYRNKHPSSLFRHFPWRQLPTYTEAFHLLHQLHEQYRALYEKLGFDALHTRVQQRLFAFNEGLSLPFFPSLQHHRLQTPGQGINPLPSLVEPLPWEDLHSFLARTAKRMHYAKAAQILQPQTGTYHIETYEVSLLDSAVRL